MHKRATDVATRTFNESTDSDAMRNMIFAQSHRHLLRTITHLCGVTSKRHTRNAHAES